MTVMTIKNEAIASSFSTATTFLLIIFFTLHVPALHNHVNQPDHMQL